MAQKVSSSNQKIHEVDGQNEQVTSPVTELLSRSESLCDEFRKCAEAHYIEEAIALNRRALDLCAPGHPERAGCLSKLSHHLWYRYEQLGGMENIEEAIGLEREALDIRSPGNQERSTSLYRLASRLYTRYQGLGDSTDLSEAIALSKEALSLCTPGHLKRSPVLNNLAVYLSERYQLLAEVKDFQDAIGFAREELELCPPGHEHQATSLNNLATYLFERYRQLSSDEDLSEAIYLDREALDLRPQGHPKRSLSLANLAIRVSARYQRSRTVEDLIEAISLDREALELRPPGHPNRPASLHNLAIRLCLRNELFGSIRDLNEAIELDREAPKLRQTGHPERSRSLNNLASYLFGRYETLRIVEDLNEAVAFGRQALELRPPGHPEWSRSLQDVTKYLSRRYKLLRKQEDEREMFSLYAELAREEQLKTVSFDGVSAARAWVNAAEEAQHSTTIFAYETALRLLVQHAAALPSLPQHHAILKECSSSLAMDAFSACLRNQSPTRAIELLEQGRTVFWNQLTRLRSPPDGVIRSGPTGRKLAEEFAHLTSSIHIALNTAGPNQHDKVCRLNSRLASVVSKIRELPGLSRFLLPSLFGSLRCAASDGPVVIMNASQYGCDAVVVLADQDPIHIPFRDITAVDVGKLASELAALTKLAKKEDVTKELKTFLRELWDLVVSRIADALLRLPACPLQSRVWWCPTAEFSLLPLHAAHPYRKDQKGFSDLYISSYTPTLSALIRARQSTSSAAPDRKRFIAIGQANASGTSKLHSVGTELDNVRRQMNRRTIFTSIEDQDACISRVTKELDENEWVHLACHGIPNKNEPFKSAFVLYDDRLTIQRIIQCNLRHAEFAYLSACHTTVGDEESPDEALHLAAAMQFAGFRSVIGTMWSVDDAQTNKITSTFYKHMVDDWGRLDHTRAAYALWKTTRSVEASLDQRILYVHIGA